MRKPRFRFNERGYFWSFPWMTPDGELTVIVGPYAELASAWLDQQTVGRKDSGTGTPAERKLDDFCDISWTIPSDGIGYC